MFSTRFLNPRRALPNVPATDRKIIPQLFPETPKKTTLAALLENLIAEAAQIIQSLIS